MSNRRCKELQKQNGRHVGDVQVFEDHHERETLGSVREYVADRVHELETCLLGSEVCGLTRCLRLRELWEDLRECLHVRIDLPGLGGAKDCAQHLHPWPIRGCASSFPASPPECPHPALPSEAADLFGEPALSNPRLAGQEPDGTTAFSHVLDRFGETTDFAIASDDG